MAIPSLASDAGNSEPAKPPPVTNSCIRTDRPRLLPEFVDSMRVIPVLDLKSGLAVAAVGGERDRYGLLHGTSEGCNPLAWARRFRDLLIAAGFPGPPALYVADLDAIEGQPPHLELFAGLASQGVSPWVDAGVRTPDDVPRLLAAGVETVIVGLRPSPALMHSRRSSTMLGLPAFALGSTSVMVDHSLTRASPGARTIPSPSSGTLLRSV